MPIKPRLSATKVKCFNTCRMKYFWTYDEELTPKEKSGPLQIGVVTHHLRHKFITGELKPEDLSNLDDYVQEEFPTNDPTQSQDYAEVAGKLLQAYVAKQQEKQIKTISSEIHVEVEEPDFFIYCRIDGLGRTQDQSLWRLECKTTSKMDSLFLSGLKSGLQAGIYHYVLEKTMKERIKGTIYELLVKVKVPYCELAMVPVNKNMIERSLRTFEGVARQIKQGDFYPSSECVGYNRECDYIHLCNHVENPSRLEEIKQAFYKKRQTPNK